MKLNNRGITSKEFLMVIIICCILLISFVPIFLDLFNSSDKKVVMNSIITFRDVVDQTIMSYVVGDEEIKDGCYDIMLTGNICLGEYDYDTNMCYADFLIIDIEGMKPNFGVVDITGHKVSALYNVQINSFFISSDEMDEYNIAEKPNAKNVCK